MWAAGPAGPDDGVLIVIGMFGGNDGLNTVVPINDQLYYGQHRGLAIRPESTLAIDASTGLNSELTVFKQFWDAGQLAIVEGVGYPDPDLSHFNSMAKWMAGSPTGIPTSGWLGRWLDGYLGGAKNLYAAAQIGQSVPLHLDRAKPTGHRSARRTAGLRCVDECQRPQHLRRVASPRCGRPRDLARAGRRRHGRSTRSRDDPRAAHPAGRSALRRPTRR